MKKALLGFSNGIRWALAVGAISLLGSQSAMATNLFWSGNGTTQGGAGTWNTTTGHFATAAAGNPAGTYNVTWANANVDSAQFGGTAGQVNLAGPLTVNLITTDITGFNIGNANSAATLNRIDFSGANSGVTTTGAANTTTLSALLGAGSVVTKSGAGRMEMGNGSNPNSVKYILKGGSMTTASIARASGTAPGALVQDFFTFDGGGWAINTGSQDTGLNRGITIKSGGAFFGTSSTTVNTTISSPIVGTEGGGLTLTNAGPFTGVASSAAGGVVTLANTGNTYNGVTTITGSGSLLMLNSLTDAGAATTLGSVSNAASNLVINGGTLRYLGAGNSTDRNFTIGTGSAGGSIDASGTAAINFTNTGNMGTTGTGTRTLVLTGTNTNNNTMSVVVVNQGANATSVSKTGAGTWIMDDNNTYTGTTTITTGALLAGNNAAFGPSGTVVLNGGTLGTSGGARTISNPAQLAVASSVTPTNNLNLSGNFTVISGLTRVLTSTTNTGTTTFSSNVFLSDAAGTAGSLTLAGGLTSLPVYTISGNVKDFNGSGLAGNIQIGNGSAASAATLNLTGTNTHSGETRVSTASLLNIGSAGALGTSTLTATGNGSFDNTTGGAQVLSNNLNLSGGSPTFVGSNDLTLGNVAIAGANRTITVSAKTLTVNNITQDIAGRGLTKGATGTGKLVVKGTGSYTGATTITAGTLQIGDGGTTGALRSGGVGTSSIVDNANLTINRSNAITQSTDITAGVISGTGSLTQAGSGVTTLDGANIYAGGTTVNNGTLATANTSGSATGSGTVTVAGGTLDVQAGSSITSTGVSVTSGTMKANGTVNGTVSVTGGTLQGTGNINGAVTVNGGTMKAGNSIGTLNLTGTLTLTSGLFDWEFSSGTVIPPTGLAGDLTNVSGGLNITTATLLSVTNLGTIPFPITPFVNGTRFTVISYSGAWNNGRFGNALNNNDYYTLGGQLWKIKYDDTPAGTVNGGAFANAVTLTAVPEASTFFVIGLGGVFAFAAVRLGKRMGVNVLNV